MPDGLKLESLSPEPSSQQLFVETSAHSPPDSRIKPPSSPVVNGGFNGVNGDCTEEDGEDTKTLTDASGCISSEPTTPRARDDSSTHSDNSSTSIRSENSPSVDSERDNSVLSEELGSEQSVRTVVEVPVGDLIDFGESSSGSEEIKMPSVQLNGSFSMQSESEESFEGVASGYASGTASTSATNLLDGPIEPLRGALNGNNSSSSPNSPHHHYNGFLPGHRKVPSTASSAAQQASQLLHQGRHPTSNYSGGSRRSSFNGSDIENMSTSDAELHGEIQDISSQVSKIQKQLNMFEENHFITDERHIRLKQDNAVLQERMHTLEEHLQQTEEKWKEKVSDEKQRCKDIKERLERERELETESLRLKLQMLERERSDASNDAQKAKDERDAFKAETSALREKSEDLEFRLKQAEEENQELAHELRQSLEMRDQTREQDREIMEELKRQNEELQTISVRPRHGSLADQTMDMADELSRLREENRSLRDHNEELTAELLQAQVETGKSLLQAADGPSLEAELGGKNKDELINELKQQEVCNQKLRAYIEGILIRVIEKHPDILEVSK